MKMHGETVKKNVKKGAYQNFAPNDMTVITLHLGSDNRATHNLPQF